MIIRSVFVAVLVLAGPAARAESPPFPPGGESAPERPWRRGRGMSWASEEDEGVPAPMPVPSACAPPPPCPPRGFAPYPPTVGLYRPHAAPAPWPSARRLYLRDRAHLALPNSQIEVKVLMELMKVNNLTSIHVGFYKSKKGDYVSVLGEKMSEKEKALWNAARLAPEEEGVAECVTLDADGLTSSPCDASLPFVCEL